MSLFIMSALILFLSITGLAQTKDNSISYPQCSDFGIKINEPCVTSKPNIYVYDKEFGGRSLNGSDVIFNENKLEHTLPAGWYENKSAALSPALLSPGNFNSSLTIFGISGIDLGGSSYSECSYGSIGSPVPLNTNCKITGPHFLYKAPYIYGSRTNDCTFNADGTTQTLTKACWFTPVSGGAYLAAPAALPMCSAAVDSSGKVSNDCTAPVTNGDISSYFYSSAYGGRSANCQSSSSGVVNSSSCFVPDDKTYYKVSGACSVGGTANIASCTVSTNNFPHLSEFGGRKTVCDDITNTSNCWFNQSLKSMGIGSNLMDSNIKSGVKIFSTTGTYPGSQTDWGTGAPKNNNEIRGTYMDESSCGLTQRFVQGSGCQATVAGKGPGYHRRIPAISSDNEGEVNSFSVDRTNWNSSGVQIQCGLTGDLNTRLNDCVSKLPNTNGNYRNGSVWNSNGSLGNSGFGTWKLVSRVCGLIGTCSNISDMVEVWRDENTKLMWSSRISTSTNWCRASGNSNNPRNAEGFELDPANICNQTNFQEQNSANKIISACYESSDIFTDNHTDFSLLSGKPKGKANLNSNLANGQKVFWRLPTLYDYRIANFNGIRFVLPDMISAGNSSEEWTATVVSQDRSKAWTFQSATGQKMQRTRSQKTSVRCIGRGF